MYRGYFAPNALDPSGKTSTLLSCPSKVIENHFDVEFKAPIDLELAMNPQAASRNGQLGHKLRTYRYRFSIKYSFGCAGGVPTIDVTTWSVSGNTSLHREVWVTGAAFIASYTSEMSINPMVIPNERSRKECPDDPGKFSRTWSLDYAIILKRKTSFGAGFDVGIGGASVSNVLSVVGLQDYNKLAITREYTHVLAEGKAPFFLGWSCCCCEEGSKSSK
jgi:hypothetical protein